MKATTGGGGPSARGLLLPAGFLLLAEGVYRLSAVHSDALAPPSAIAVAWVAALRDGSLLAMTAQTLACALAGLAIATVTGLLVGILFGVARPVDRLMAIVVEALRPIPSVALFPIAMLIFGLGYSMEISVVAFAAVWPVLLYTRMAVRGIEPRLLEVARALRLPSADKVRKIILPAVVPQIFVAVRIAAGIALIVAVTLEITANPIGLGAGMMSAAQSFRPETMFALLFWIGAVGWAFNALLLWIQRALFGAMSRIAA